jgi:arabinofuranosyltransferase
VLTGGPLTDQEQCTLRVVALLWSGVLLLVLIRTAWVCDDAYITFRTIDNWVNGYGVRWNIAERVQSYTHPLWMLLVAAPYAVTREPYYTSLAISLVLSLVAAYLLFTRVAVDLPAAIRAGLILILSKAFVDYSTSGLENPLTHLLLVAFFLIYLPQFSPALSERRLPMLGLVTALLAINHTDTALIVLPALAVAAWQRSWPRAIVDLTIGLTPVLAWEAFSIVYYGFPFPNTAYAKLFRAGLPLSESIAQGLIYLLDSLALDPLTLATVAAAFVAALIGAARTERPLVVGIACYLLYVVRIGGDFMSGRLLTPAFFGAALILSRLHSTMLTSPVSILTYVTIVAVGFMSPRPTLLSDAQAPRGRATLQASGIADERLFYYPERALLTVTRGTGLPGKAPPARHVAMSDAPLPVQEEYIVGLTGYNAGPQVHILDRYGLSEPLLARLPYSGGPWRPGHLARDVPTGYRETLQSGVIQLQNARLAQYYERLSLIVRGRIFEWRRFRAIIRMNLGLYDHLLSPVP